MKTKIKLKPCPFCGKRGRIFSGLTGWGVREYQGACRNRGCSVQPETRFTENKRLAIDAWNLRMP